MNKYHVTVDWDLTDEDLADFIEHVSGPPSEMVVTVPDDCDDVEEYISDRITQDTGFCHDGFKYKIEELAER